MNYTSMYHRNHISACLMVDKIFQAMVPEIIKVCEQNDQLDYELLEAVLYEIKDVHNRIMSDLEYHKEEAEKEESKMNGED